MFRNNSALVAVLAIGFTVSVQALSYENLDTETRIVNAENDARAYKLFIFTPDAPAPKDGYPVIYLLDGNSVFWSMADEVRRKTALGYGDPAVVVAIGYPGDDVWNARRARDLTPWASEEDPLEGDSQNDSIKHGGADEFLAVIRTRIIPAVERDKNIDPNRRTLAGHSYGGLFTLHTLFMKTGLFQSYAAASPSIWYADERIYEELEEYAATQQSDPDNTRLLIMVGGCEETPGECDPLRAPSEEADEWLVKTARMVSNASALYDKLHEIRGNAVRLRILEGENHTSVIGGTLAWTAAFAMTSGPEPTPASSE
jgi:predicted alpha/beta superfamily hydrolase